MTPAFLEGPAGPLAYDRLPGRGPTVVFLGGLASNMTGMKATFLHGLCRGAGRAFLRFDWRGHGASAGQLEDGTIGGWAEDALAVIAALTDGPVVLVGSSMGGWVMLEAALALPAGRVAAMVGIAAAPDFTEELVWQRLGEDARAAFRRDGVMTLPTPHDPTGYRIGLGLIEEGRSRLRLRGPIPLAIPVRLLHGQRDTEVPWETSLRLAGCLTAEDVRVTLVKDGDHRLSRPADLALLGETLSALLD